MADTRVPLPRPKRKDMEPVVGLAVAAPAAVGPEPAVVGPAVVGCAVVEAAVVGPLLPWTQPPPPPSLPPRLSKCQISLAVLNVLHASPRFRHKAILAMQELSVASGTSLEDDFIDFLFEVPWVQGPGPFSLRMPRLDPIDDADHLAVLVEQLLVTDHTMVSKEVVIGLPPNLQLPVCQLLAALRKLQERVPNRMANVRDDVSTPFDFGAEP
jgi:hypothetical protein